MMTPLVGFQMVGHNTITLSEKQTGVRMAGPIANLISYTVTGAILYLELKKLGKLEADGLANEGTL